MKLIIAGSRSLKVSTQKLDSFIKYLIPHTSPITEVVSGCARGVDKAGEIWAEHMCIPIKRFQADWNEYGKAAGPIRNAEMARYADCLILIWDGKSRGSENMLKNMQLLKKWWFSVEVNLESLEVINIASR